MMPAPALPTNYPLFTVIKILNDPGLRLPLSRLQMNLKLVWPLVSTGDNNNSSH